MSETTYAEQELKEGKEMANGRSQPASELDLFFELSHDMLCVAGTDGYFKRVNPAFERTLGWTTAELLSRPFWGLIHPDDIPATQSEMAKLSQGHTTLIFENRYQCKSGEYKWLAWSAQPTSDGTLYAIARDVTQQKQIEETFQRAEKTYQRTAAGASGFVFQFLLTADGKASFPYVNEAAGNLLEVSPELLQEDASKILEFIAPEHSEELQRLLNQSAQTLEAFQWEGLFTLPSGTQKWFQAISYPERLTNGDTLWYGFWTDITAQRRARVAMQEAQALTQTVLQSITVPLLISRIADGKVLYANHHLANMVRLPLENVVGQITPDFYYNPEDRPLFLQTLRNQGFVTNYEIQIKRSDGDVFWGLISAQAINYQGEAAIIATFLEITERKQAEIALAKQAAEMETVARISTAVAGTLDVQKLLQDVADLTKSSFNLYHAHILLLNDAGDALVPVAGAGELGQMLSAGSNFIELARPQSLIARAARTRQPVAVNDVSSDPDYFSHPLLADTRAELVLPLIARNELLGVFDLLADTVGRFTQQDINILTTLATQIAVALQNARQYQQVQQRTLDLQEASNFLDSVLEHLPVGLFMKEAETLRFVRWNRANAELIGFSQEEVLGKNDYDFFPKEEADFFVSADRQVLNSNEILDIAEEEVKTVHQGIRILHTRKLPILDANNKPKYLLGISEDITERKRAEADLHEAQARTQAILQSVTVPLLISRLADGKILYANNHLADMVRVPLDNLVGQQTPDFYYNPEDRQVFLQTLRSQGFITNYELRIKRADGDVLWVVISAQTLNFQGEAAIIVTLLDIQERKQAEESLRAGMERHRLILELSPDPVVLYDPTGKAEYVNAAFTQVFGWAQEELLGKRIDFVPEESQAETANALRRLMTEGIVQGFETDRLTRDGKRLNVLISGSVIRDENGNVVESVVILRDITERKRVEQALAKQAADLETVAQISTAVATTRDTQQLLQDMVDLTKYRFNLYHSHVYLLDETGNTLVLTAGAGDVGRSMVAEGRQIPLSQEQSLVAQAARNRRGVIENNVQKNPHFLPHPLLPDTRSEMAVPLVVGERVLGVLDVQSDVIGRFTLQDINIQTTLAAQVAVALENARSFEESEKARQELNALTRRLTQEGWENYLSPLETSHRYAYDLQRGLLTETITNGETTPTTTLSNPLTLQGQMIGQLILDDPQFMAEEAADIMNAVAERLSLHLENLRLSEETGRALAQTEVLYEGSGRIVRASTIQEVMQALISSTTLQNLDRANVILYDRPWTDVPPNIGTVSAVWEKSGQPSRAPIGTVYQVVHFPTVHLFSPDTPIIFRDMETDERVDANFRALFQRLGMRGLVIFPLVAAGQWIGFISGQSSTPLNMTEEQVRQISSLAGQAATVIQNLRLFDQAQARAERERYVRTISDKIRKATSREAMLQVATEEISQMLGASKTIAQLGTPDQLLARLQPSKESDGTSA